MSSQRPARRDADSYPAAPLWAQNGTVAAAGGGGGATNGDPPPRLAVPKMGVRARIADWPPKRDAGKEATGNREATANRGFAGGHQPLAGVSGFKALHRLARRRSKEVEFHEGWPRSPARGLAPLRHRSSSEVTLSECDGEETAEARGATGLYREYGSTSSIDVQGISEQSFYELLNGFRAEKPERGAAPVPDEAAFSSITTAAASPGAKTDPAAQGKDKARRRYPRSGGGGDDSIFKKLRGPRADGEASKEVEEARAPEPGKAWVCQKSFAHYDVQSMFFDLNAVAGNRLAVAQRRNTTTGASAASAGVTAGAGTEELNRKENLEHDGGDDTSNELLLSCPHFRNEIGGAGERDVAFARAAAVPSLPLPGGDGGIGGVAVDPALAPGRPTNAGVSVLEAPKELQRSRQRLKRFSVEHADLGARYYRDHFHGKGEGGPGTPAPNPSSEVEEGQGDAPQFAQSWAGLVGMAPPPQRLPHPSLRATRVPPIPPPHSPTPSLSTPCPPTVSLRCPPHFSVPDVPPLSPIPVSPPPRTLQLLWPGREAGPGGRQPQAGEAGGPQGARPTVPVPPHLPHQRGTAGGAPVPPALDLPLPHCPPPPHRSSSPCAAPSWRTPPPQPPSPAACGGCRRGTRWSTLSPSSTSTACAWPSAPPRSPSSSSSWTSKG